MGEWQSADTVLRAFREYEEKELDKRRLIEWLMQREWTPEGRK